MQSSTDWRKADDLLRRMNSNLSLVEAKVGIMPIRKSESVKGIELNQAEQTSHCRYTEGIMEETMSTFLDLLSTMPLIRGEAEFEKAIDRVLSDIKNFDRDVKVQVFEGQDR
jgi:hypothetical protein